MPVKAQSISYSFSKKEIQDVIAASVECPSGYKVKSVQFKIKEVDCDPMDRYPGIPDVVEVVVELAMDDLHF
jgi:hypothetical protein